MNWETKWEIFMRKTWPIIAKWSTGILILLLLCILFFRECTRPEECSNTIQIDTIIVPGDSVPFIKEVPKPYPVTQWRVEWKHDTLDCSEVMDQFLTAKAYNRVLWDDTSAYIALKDTVWANELGTGQLSFMNRRPQKTVIINTITGDKLRNRYYIGLQVNGVLGSAVTPISFGPRVLVVLKGAFAFGGSYDPFNKIASVDAQWKISFKKKK